jgi:crotonobetainyl-CoA:carnitine CoA-transferase CaiB-like acyl-CoA transferase
MDTSPSARRTSAPSRSSHHCSGTEWLRDPRFTTDAARVAHRAELAAAIEANTVTASCEQWLTRLEAAGIPCGPIRNYAEVFADPHVAAREMAIPVEHPTLGALTTLGTPLKMSATPLDPHRRAPLLGEHTESVLREFGFTDAQILQLLS